MNNKALFLYISFYLIWVSLSFGVFLVLRPFSYIDNTVSYIICDKDRSRFEIGPNFIYTFTHSLDEFNDKKARKLCEFGLVKDYADSLKTPGRQNYAFYPIYTTESSWIDAVIISFITFLVGLITIELISSLIFGFSFIGKRLFDFFISLIY